MKLRGFLQNDKEQEIAEIILSVLIIAFAITIFYSKTFKLELFFSSILVSILSILPFLLIQKYTAHIQDVRSTIKLWKLGSLLALLAPFMGILFAAPNKLELHYKRARKFGYKETDLTSRQEGLTAVSGPLMCILIGLIIALTPLNKLVILELAMRVNFSIALVNLLPISPLSGYKVITWRPLWWFIWQLVSLVLVIIT